MIKRVNKMKKENKKEEITKKIIEFLRKEGAKSISLFGSFARDEENPKSDIDIIVEFNEVKSLLDIVRIERELGELLGIKIDLLTENSISPYLYDVINKEKKVIYA
ncbi:MAG TPA: nucleotidyltransferase family protein [bacterium]|nr:nucleotidyltransferase family protein [bacterium]HPP30160.1 nucleotidyltransferase family protein [bacterium]